jgi:hypothetical protein
MRFDNRGGIKRGDRADTGDEQARPNDGVDQGGSGVEGGGSNDVGHPTADASALGGTRTIDTDPSGRLSGDDDLTELDVRGGSDPSLGLTNVGGQAPEDWAADTGPTRTGEADSRGATRELAEQGRSASGEKIDFKKRVRRPGK